MRGVSVHVCTVWVYELACVFNVNGLWGLRVARGLPSAVQRPELMYQGLCLTFYPGAPNRRLV